MTPAPTLKGYVCRMCGNEAIQQPWNDTDGFVCKDCGAGNEAPLKQKATFMDPIDMTAGTVTAREFAELFWGQEKS